MSTDQVPCPSWCPGDHPLGPQTHQRVTASGQRGSVILSRFDYSLGGPRTSVAVFFDGNLHSVSPSEAPDLANLIDALAHAKWLTDGLRSAAELAEGVSE